MIKIDHHIHTDNSFDSVEKVKNMCEKAVSEGIEIIGFGEHFSTIERLPTYGHMNFQKYDYEIECCRRLFKDKLEILKGLEICSPQFNIDSILKTVKDEGIDFIIGSVHDIDGPKLRKYIEGKSNKDAYEGYFKKVLEVSEKGEYDILGHIDLLKRYAFEKLGNYEFCDFKGIISEILNNVIRRGKAIEINTSGLDCGANELFPSIRVLKLYKELGGKLITIGSDAHSAEKLGNNHEIAVNALRDLGYGEYYYYKQRKPQRVVF
ncbi:histidinol-phosphatase HisJ family protein [Oceanirhabdus sp. W0125-5]|uniref:histidinol-phosphatase HisJ family protein n=1 Tax=Oceanirhabdus sp. W0125-5 TaxID=2999116 RepID=UPI0022F2C27A|nr:histidinol-phosphatase HisJ family protein [Oceanirhabdus sp. W0125-5]WBW99319.1 histidinol-phosphatase HisJ family protein [Oceanirhabdus sp. W0125-5]